MKSAANALAPGGASADLGLGLGDQLKSQMEAEVLARKKKAMQIAGADQGQGVYNVNGLSTAAMSLGLYGGSAR